MILLHELRNHRSVSSSRIEIEQVIGAQYLRFNFWDSPAECPGSTACGGSSPRRIALTPFQKEAPADPGLYDSCSHTRVIRMRKNSGPRSMYSHATSAS